MKYIFNTLVTSLLLYGSIVLFLHPLWNNLKTFKSIFSQKFLQAKKPVGVKDPKDSYFSIFKYGADCCVRWEKVENTMQKNGVETIAAKSTYLIIRDLGPIFIDKVTFRSFWYVYTTNDKKVIKIM